MNGSHRAIFFSPFPHFSQEKKSPSESAREEKSKSRWHLNNKAMLVYFLCKKSSVRKPLLWNTCHSPFYWTLLTPHVFGLKVIPLSVPTSPSVLEMDCGRWKGKHTHTLPHTLTRWTAQIIKVIATHGRRSSHLSLLQMKPDQWHWLTVQRESLPWKVPEAGRTFQPDHQDLHKITQTNFMSCFLKNKTKTELN